MYVCVDKRVHEPCEPNLMLNINPNQWPITERRECRQERETKCGCLSPRYSPLPQDDHQIAPPLSSSGLLCEPEPTTTTTTATGVVHPSVCRSEATIADITRQRTDGSGLSYVLWWPTKTEEHTGPQPFTQPYRGKLNGMCEWMKHSFTTTTFASKHCVYVSVCSQNLTFALSHSHPAYAWWLLLALFRPYQRVFFTIPHRHTVQFRRPRTHSLVLLCLLWVCSFVHKYDHRPFVVIQRKWNVPSCRTIKMQDTSTKAHVIFNIETFDTKLTENNCFF